MQHVNWPEKQELKGMTWTLTAIGSQSEGETGVKYSFSTKKHLPGTLNWCEMSIGWIVSLGKHLSLRFTRKNEIWTIRTEKSFICSHQHRARFAFQILHMIVFSKIPNLRSNGDPFRLPTWAEPFKQNSNYVHVCVYRVKQLLGVCWSVCISVFSIFCIVV